MKLKSLASAAMLVGGLMAGSSAWSLSIGDVGGEDNFLGSTYLASSGDAVEEAWVESVLGFDVSFDSKDESGSAGWELLDGETDVYASALDTDPMYFLLKLGTGGTTGLDSHYLFENVGDLAWAVVDFSDAGVDFTVSNIGIDRLSHVSEFDGTSVPEPATLLLVGLGLAGLGYQRKRS